MISAFRRALDTWVVRGFFLILVVFFIIWGVGDVARMIGGGSTWVSKVGDQTIEGPQFQAEFQRALNQATRNLPSGQDASADLRRQIGNSVLQRLIGQAALAQEVRRMRIVTPDNAVRDATFAIQAFHGADGKFDHATFEAVLRNNGLTEPRFIDMLRSDLSQRQLLEAVAAGGRASKMQLTRLYQGQFEKRSADIVEFPFASEAVPVPTEAQLQRWYDNNPDRYRMPEMRRIKAIILSPQTMAKDIPISDQDVRAAYEQRKAQFVTPEKRSVQVISAGDAAKAQALASQGAAVLSGRRFRLLRRRPERRPLSSTRRRSRSFLILRLPRQCLQRPWERSPIRSRAALGGTWRRS